METLRHLRGPLLPALAFRHAWEAVARRLQRSRPLPNPSH